MDVATHNLSAVYKHKKGAWKKCVDDDIPLPITKTDVHDENGKFLHQKHFENIPENDTTKEDKDFELENPEKKR